MARIVISDHARFEMQRRGISEDAVLEVALAPEQVVPSSGQREIRQSLVEDALTGKTMLLRLVVVRDEETIFVVTAYKTSKVEKHWRREVN